MRKDRAVSFWSPAFRDELSELVREGAQRLIRRAAVRNGYQPEREVLTGIGPVRVQVPKTRDRRREGRCFRSELLPPYLKKARRVEAVLPWLYLKGVTTNDFDEALRALFGESAKLLFLAIRNAGVRWRRPIDWIAAMGQFAILFEALPAHNSLRLESVMLTALLTQNSDIPPENPCSALLGPQDGQRPRQAAQEPARRCQVHAARDLAGRYSKERGQGVGSLRGHLRSKVSQGGRLPGQGP